MSNAPAYRLQERIGEGGGGHVYRAKLWRSGRTVAVKRLNEALSDTPHRLARLQNEASALASLQHPNIVQFLGVRHARDRRCAIVMEYVDGTTLARLLRAGPMTLSASVYVVRSVLRALAHAHEQGIVHRDLSPRNVLISWDGEVKLVDFGISLEIGDAPTTGNDVSGSLPYLAPEQLLDNPIDGRADLFAVGVLLHAIVAGRPPFATSVRNEAIAQILTRTPDCQAVPVALQSVITRLLERERTQRYQSAEDALRELPKGRKGRDELVELMSARVARSTTKRFQRAWLVVAVSVGCLAGVNAWNSEPSADT